MKKRLVIVIWNMGIGGIQKRMRDVTLDVSEHQKDWEIFFLIRRRGESQFVEPLKKINNIHLLYYPHQGIRFPLGFIVWTAWQYVRLRPAVTLTFLAQMTIVMAFIRKIIFWHSTKLVVNEGAFMSGYLKFNALEYLHLPLRWAYQSVDSLIVPTVACKEDLMKSFDVKPEHIHVIPNWTLLAQSTAKKDRYDILFIGRFEVEKNPIAMVKLVELLRASHAYLRAGMAGDGRMKEKIQKLILQKGLQNAVDMLLPQMAHEALQRSRVLIVPSFNEGMPNVVLEAAMSRVPTVANNFAGSDEVIVDGKTGYIADSPSDTAKKTLLLLNDHDALTEMGRQAQLYIRKNFHRARQKEFIDVLLGEIKEFP